MKNLTFEAVTNIQTTSKKFKGQCEFRLHDGKLFWHGCPKPFGQTEHARYIWPNNACVGTCAELNETNIVSLLTAYVRAIDSTATISIEFGEKKLVNEKARRIHTDATPAAEPAPAPEVAPSQTSEPEPEPEFAEAVEIVEMPAAEPTPEAEVEPADAAQTIPATDDALQLLAILSRMKSGNVDEATVRKIVVSELKKLAHTEPEAVEHAIQTASLEDEIKVEKFDAIVRDVKDGFYPYLEGAAGCGKSYTAEQIARACGLKFYPMQQVIMAHQVEGYGDAAGRYVPTPVYEAFAHGGLVFFDEFDGSRPEAAIVINNMLANGEYSFPVVGRVQAHPNFRCIFAGNTCGKGADEEYTGRDVLDGSTRDRLIDYKMTYDRRVELKIAGGDDETVDFIEDVRRAVEKTGIRHIISYRATKYAVARKDDMQSALLRGVVKFLEKDEMRLIYQALDNKECAWAKAFAAIIK